MTWEMKPAHEHRREAVVWFYRSLNFQAHHQPSLHASGGAVRLMVWISIRLQSSGTKTKFGYKTKNLSQSANTLLPSSIRCSRQTPPELTPESTFMSLRVFGLPLLEKNFLKTTSRV